MPHQVLFLPELVCHLVHNNLKHVSVSWFTSLVSGLGFTPSNAPTCDVFLKRGSGREGSGDIISYFISCFYSQWVIY